MNRLREKFVGEGFEILAVNFQEGEPRIRNFLLKVPVSFPIVRDTDGAVARAWNVRIFPSSFVVDRNGDTRYALVGPVDWSSRDVEQTSARCCRLRTQAGGLARLCPSARCGCACASVVPRWGRCHQGITSCIAAHC